MIRVGDGTNCHLRGASRDIEAVGGALHISPGETSEDGAFTFEVVYCPGACAHGSVALIVGQIRRQASEHDVVDKIGLLQ